MLNLIKPEQRKKIISEYRMRVIVVAVALLLAAEVIGLILLLPSFLTSYTRIQVLNSQSVVLKLQNITEETATLNNQVKLANDYLKILSSSTAPSGVDSVLQKIVENRGGKIKINGFAYRVQNEKQQINIQGVAASRQDLVDFNKRLKQQPGVIASDLPISDYAAAQNIIFSLTVLFDPKLI